MIRVVIFDLDGTIYFGNRLAENVHEVLDELHGKGIRTCFLTNNSRKGRVDIHEKLLGFGLELELEDVYTASYLAGRYLKDHGYGSAYVLGEAGLINEIEGCGVRCVEDDPDCVVVGYDMTLNYEKITRSFRHVMDKKPFVACNLDKSYPVESGLLPGCGAMVGAITGCTGISPGIVVGKPSVYPIKVICKDLGVDVDSVMVVGDNVESDIAMARSVGCKSCLVVTDDVARDCLVVKSLDQIIGIINGEA